MKETIEKLAEKLMLVDPQDLPGLAEIHGFFEEVVKSDQPMAATWAKPLAKHTADTLQDLILDDVADPKQALEQIVASATALEQLVLGECNPDDIDLPASFKSQVDEMIDMVDSATKTISDVETINEDSDTISAKAEEPSDEPDASAKEPAQLTGDLELTAEFITEAREHLESADQCLLTIEDNPDDLDTVNALFRAYHTIKGVAGFLDLTDVMHLAHQTENLLDAARQGKLKLDGVRLDAVFDATDMMRGLVDSIAEALESGGQLERDEKQAELMNRLSLDQAEADEPEQNTASETAASPAEPAVLAEDENADVDGSPDTTAETDHDEEEQTPPQLLAEAETVASAPQAAVEAESEAESEAEAETDPAPVAAEPEAPEEASAAPAAARKTVAVRETVKVDSNRLDVMIDAIGELVIAEAMVTQSPKLLSVIDDDMERRLSHLSKITRELQEMATSLRLMPIRATFQRMARLARDTAKKLDKRIEFVTTGDETELDKNVVDQIGDPLVHMVRNAVDHGLEDSEEQRTAAGKSPVGKVELRAFHKGGSIYIEIADDGAGLDRDRILKKAVERGLIEEDQKLSDQEVFLLIMEPGFSTATKVSDVSGRGVGMDVVRKNIQKMRGQIEIQSTPGKGTTFSIRLPLTLAIIDGMVVRVANRRYVIPLLSITRMLRPDESRIPTVFNQAEMLQADEGLIPLYRVHRLFNIPDAITNPMEASVVVVEHEGKRVGLLIDELLGQQQIVIKSLGESMRGIEGIAGGAIMPDGRVGLIMDLDSLIRLAGTIPSDRVAA